MEINNQLMHHRTGKSGVHDPALLTEKIWQTGILLLFIFICCPFFVSAQLSADQAISYTGGGTMGKKTIVPDLEKLAIAQATLIFKTGTTKEFFRNERGAFGRRKAGGGAIAMRATAFLEFSDGDMTDADYRELTDYFYTALQDKLKVVGVQPVSWDQIAQTAYYQSAEDEKEQTEEAGKQGQLYVTYNANAGKTIANFGPYKKMNAGFAFGKAKKIAGMSKDLGAPTVFIHAVVDFIDLFLEGDVKTNTSTRDHSLSQGYSIVSRSRNFTTNAQAFPDVKIAAPTGETDILGIGEGGRFLFYNEKTQADYMDFALSVPSGVAFADQMDQDPNRKAVKTGNNIFASNFKYEPVVVVTTREKYKSAARKALENAASLIAEKIKISRKS